MVGFAYQNEGSISCYAHGLPIGYKMSRLTGSLIVAFIAAVLISIIWKPVPIEQRLLELQVEELLPEYADGLNVEAPELQALFIDYAPNQALRTKAWLALQRYPQLTRPILTLYGNDALFREVLTRHGESIIPPIHYFLSNDIDTLTAQRKIEQIGDSIVNAWNSLWGKEKDPVLPQEEAKQNKLTPEERGWYAVTYINSEGHDFLGQFEVSKDGRKVGWTQSRRLASGLTNIFAGGVIGLETKYRREEDVGLSDFGWAALDLAVGVSAFKLVKLGRTAAVTGRTMTYSERSVALGSSLLRGSRVGLKFAKYAAPLALAYLAVTHPSLLNSIFGHIAEFLGFPAIVVQILCWAIVLLPVMFVLPLLLRPLVGVSRMIFRPQQGLVGRGLCNGD
jgi:uncharacterized membrane protein YhdT